MSVKEQPRGRPRLLFPVAVLLACFAYVYGPEILGDFRLLHGDLVDGRLADALQLHWSNVFAGHEGWRTPVFYQPTPDTLGYNDGYFLFGVFGQLPRALGCDDMLAAEIASWPFRLIGFAGILVFARDALRLPDPLALLCAALGIMSNGLMHQQFHVQLLTVYLAPAVAALLFHAVRSVRRGRSGRGTVYGVAAALTIDAWALTGFYMLEFTLMLFGLVAVVAALARPRAVPAALRLLSRPPFLIPMAVCLLGLAPTFAVYLPVLAQTGPHDWAEIEGGLLRAKDLVDLGEGNVLGDLVGGTGRAFSEHQVGWPPLVWILAILGAGLSLGRRSSPCSMPMAAGSILLLLLCLRYGAFAPWHAILALVPGTSALRVICRVMLLLAIPAAMLACVALAWLRDRGLPAPLIVVLALALVVEELGTADARHLNRLGEDAWLNHISTPPADCPLFVVSRARPFPVPPAPPITRRSC